MRGARQDVPLVSLGAVAIGPSSSAPGRRPRYPSRRVPTQLRQASTLLPRVPGEPLLVLWANLHGTVTLGMLLVLLAVAADAWSKRSLTRRSAALAMLAVASLFASPYAPHLLGYYHTVLFNGEFAKYLPDWMPTALAPRTAAFYLLAFAAVFAIARAENPLFEVDARRSACTRGRTTRGVRGSAVLSSST